MALSALRINQTAAASLGVNVHLHKNLAHALGAVLVAVGGGIYAVYFQYIHPDQVFGFEISIGMVLMPVIGGLGTLWGPVLGGTLYYAIQDTLLTIFPFAHLLVYGLLLMVIMLIEPRGLLGFARLLRPIVRRRPVVRARSDATSELEDKPGLAVPLDAARPSGDSESPMRRGGPLLIEVRR